MPVDVTENEIRVRVRNPGEFKRILQMFPRKEDQTETHAPYNSEGIRGIGGPLKRTGKVEIQAFIFSRDDRYNWTPAKAEKWVKDEGYTPKGYSEPQPPIDFEYAFNITSVKSAKAIPRADRIEVDKDTEVVYVEGWASTETVDRDQDVVDQATIDVTGFLKNPIILFNHDANSPVGKAVRVEPNMETSDGRKGLWIRAAIIGNTIKGKEAIELIKAKVLRTFSVQGKAKSKRRVCNTQGICFNKLIGMSLWEVSLAPLQSNEDALFSVVKSLLNEAYPTHGQSDFGEAATQEETHMDKKPEVTTPPQPGQEVVQKQEPAPELEERLAAIEAQLADALARLEKLEQPPAEPAEEAAALEQPPQPKKPETQPEEKMPEPGDVVVVEGEGVRKSVVVVQKATEKGKLEVKKATRDQRKQMALDAMKRRQNQ